MFDINNPRLQYIFNKETDELSKSFAALKKTIGEGAAGIKAFKLEVMICLWFCIHKESLEEVKLIFNLDPIAKDIIKNIREVGRPEIKARDEELMRKKNKGRRINLSSADMSKSMLNNSADFVEEKEEIKEDEENPDEKNFENLKELQDINWLLKEKPCGIPFNTNILRMSLNSGEEMIAQMLVANYQIAIDHKMMVRSIKTR